MKTRFFRNVPRYASALQGRLAEGRALLEEAIREDLCAGSGYAYRVAWLSEDCRLVGRADAARQYACQALDLARPQKARGDEALALHQLGTVHAHSHPRMSRRPKSATNRP